MCIFSLPVTDFISADGILYSSCSLIVQVPHPYNKVGSADIFPPPKNVHFSPLPSPPPPRFTLRHLITLNPVPFSTNPDAPRPVVFSTLLLPPVWPLMELFRSTFPTVTVQIARPLTRMRTYSHERRPVCVPGCKEWQKLRVRGWSWTTQI